MNKKIGSILLISCTTIGGGILALPMQTAINGFLPTSIIFIICWLCMTFAALCLLEVCLHQANNSNLISIARKTLGLPGASLAWITYLGLLYALISAYLTASSAWVISFIKHLCNILLPLPLALFLLATLMSIMIFFGTHLVDRINRLFSILLFATFICLIILGMPYIETANLLEYKIQSSHTIVPLILTTFGFSVIVPSLAGYLDYQRSQLYQCVLLGSMIPLTVYLLWEFMTLGILQKTLFLQNATDGTEIAHALQTAIGQPSFIGLTTIFSIAAIITSFIGVSLSLFDFLADGFSLNIKTTKDKIKLFILCFLPPMLMVIYIPNSFNLILSKSGILVAILLGLLPMAMFYVSNKNNHILRKKYYFFPVMLFFCLAILQEIF